VPVPHTAVNAGLLPALALRNRVQRALVRRLLAVAAMKNETVIALGMLAAAAVIDGCVDDETASTTATTSAASTTSTGGSGGSGSEVGGSGGTGGAGATGGMGGDGAGGSSMGASERCQACVAEVYANDVGCQAAVQACDADAACNDWKNCSEDCFNGNDTVACYDACDQAFPHENALSDALLACTCDACAKVCVATCSSS
jgi:hypothetical protein